MKIYSDCVSCDCTFSSGCKFENALNQRIKAKKAADLVPEEQPETRRRGTSAGTGFRQKMRAFKAQQLAQLTGDK